MAWSRNRGSAGHLHVEGRLTRGDLAILRRGELRTTAPGLFPALARPTGRDAAARGEPQEQAGAIAEVCGRWVREVRRCLRAGWARADGGLVGFGGRGAGAQAFGLQEVGSVGRTA